MVPHVLSLQQCYVFLIGLMFDIVQKWRGHNLDGFDAMRSDGSKSNDKGRRRPWSGCLQGWTLRTGGERCYHVGREEDDGSLACLVCGMHPSVIVLGDVLLMLLFYTVHRRKSQHTLISMNTRAQILPLGATSKTGYIGDNHITCAHTHSQTLPLRASSKTLTDKSSRLTKSPQTSRCRRKHHLPLKAQIVRSWEIHSHMESNPWPKVQPRLV
jgi:hypothetical protein